METEEIKVKLVARAEVVEAVRQVILSMVRAEVTETHAVAALEAPVAVTVVATVEMEGPTADPTAHNREEAVVAVAIRLQAEMAVTAR